MFDKKDTDLMASKGIRPEMVENQLEAFRKGFPRLKIVAPATPSKGIKVLSEEEIEKSLEAYAGASVAGKRKFVPASGAASRMFKDLFSGLDRLRAGETLPEDSPAAVFVSKIERFAFYDSELFPGRRADETESAYMSRILETVLLPCGGKGLGYGSKPKGVLKFHRYADGSRTPFEEHLVEAQDYMRNNDGTANLTVTISPEHEGLFRDLLASVKGKYEEKYCCRYNVDFTYQEKFTDTIAVDMDNRPFRTDEGSLLFRPGGHGALIYNLNKIDDEFVSIKNIDNVAIERFLPQTSLYKKVLLGQLVSLRDRIHGYLKALDRGEDLDALLPEIVSFFSDCLCVEIPKAISRDDLPAYLRKKLNRPIRVCGMVRNQGEPGGGPFIIREKDGSTSLQILENDQIDRGNPDSVAALAASTHFNPVDLACCIRDYKGSKFDLLEYVDGDTAFISRKSHQGRELKALELPGLWNGSMSDWNTLFVEVPLITFNPVKVALDLLRLEHLG